MRTIMLFPHNSSIAVTAKQIVADSEIGRAIKTFRATLARQKEERNEKNAQKSQKSPSIQAKPKPNHDRNALADSLIVEQINTLMRENSLIHQDKLKIHVSEGWVDIKGSVDWNFQQADMIQSISHIQGVSEVHLRMFAFK